MKIKYFILMLAIVIISTTEMYSDEPMVAMPTIVVLPKAVGGVDALTMLRNGSSLQSKAANAIGQILLERKLTVLNLEQAINNFDAVRAQMPGVSSDNNAAIAAASGADVYFEFVVDIIPSGPAKKATVDIAVFEAATAIELARGSGASDAIMPPNNDEASLTRIAARNPMDRILESVRQFWKDVPDRGVPITLVINFSSIEVNDELPNGEYLEEAVDDWIKANSKTRKLKSSTAHTIEYTYIYIDHVKYDEPSVYGRELRQFFSKSLGLKIDLQSKGKLIRIQEK